MGTRGKLLAFDTANEMMALALGEHQVCHRRAGSLIFASTSPKDPAQNTLSPVIPSSARPKAEARREESLIDASRSNAPTSPPAEITASAGADASCAGSLTTASGKTGPSSARDDAPETLAGAPLTLVAAADAPARRCANQVLVPRVQDLLAHAGWGVRDIDAIVVGRGPGSFTGVRIGIACAKGLAVGLGVPVYGVSTLDAVAWRAWQAGIRGRIGVVADAMRKEVYPVRYLLDDAGVQRLDNDSVAKPADVAAAWQGSGEQLLLLGDGLHKHAACFAANCFELGPEELWTVSGEGLLLAYAAAAAAGTQGCGDPVTLLPVYTRLSDAEENERKRLALLDDMPASGVADQRAVGGLFLHPMSVNDVAAVAALQEQAMPADAWTENTLRGEIGRADRSWWVARKDGEIVGCAGGQVIDGELNILNVAVAPAARRAHVATRLVERVAGDGRALGATSVFLEVRAGNEAAITLYETLGLKRIGTRPRFYHGSEDAVIMRGPLPLQVLARNLSEATPGVSSHGYEAAQRDADPPYILAIESSCDETACAIIDAQRHVLSDCIASQIDFHSRFGGVVPEIASRKHIEAIVPTVETTLEEAGLSLGELSAIAVTQGPGLVGALVVGVAFAKGLALACGLPLIGVNHLEGHLYANRLIDPALEPPFVALLVSGGHTMLVHVRSWGSYEVLGSTLDDAVGEAFDKVAKALSLGYPGGPIISRFAAQGDPKAIDFPRAMMHSGDFAFSLSGLKTAVVTYIDKCNRAGVAVSIPNLAASFQQAVVDVLVYKARKACEQAGVHTLCIGGGVAANPALRAQLQAVLEKRGIRVVMPSLAECTDNASMIAAVALDLYEEGDFADFSIDPIAHMPLRNGI